MKDGKLLTLQDQFDKTSRQLESAQQSVKRLESQAGDNVVQTPRRASVTPHKRESSINIGTSAADTEQRIAELETKLAEKEQETKDLEVKLFEASFVNTAATKNVFDEDAPLPASKQPRTASRNLFDDQPLPTVQRQDVNQSSHNIASRHKGSSISFSYNNTPPDQRKPGKYPSTDVFKTPSHCHNDQIQNTPATARHDSSSVSQSSSSSQLVKDPLLQDADVGKLELTIKNKEAEISRLRVELAAAQSKLEQVQSEVKKNSDEMMKRESQVGKLQLEVDNNKNKVCLNIFKDKKKLKFNF